MSKQDWFEVDQTTQKLEVCRESALDMLAPTDGPPIRASHLQIEAAPPTTDYIRVMFRAPQPVVVIAPTKPPYRRFLFVPIGVLLIASAVVIAVLQ